MAGRLFLHNIFVTVTSLNNALLAKKPAIQSHLASGKFALTESTGCIMYLFAFFPLPLPLRLTDRGYILQRAQCFPKVSPRMVTGPPPVPNCSGTAA